MSLKNKLPIHKRPEVLEEYNILKKEENYIEETLNKPKPKELGTPVEDIIKEEMFPAPEGSANMYYGLIRSGKTYGATADIIELLKQGQLVYGTWPLNLKDYDDRKSLFLLIVNTLLFKKRFYVMPRATNYHFINADTGEVDGIPTFNPKSAGEYLKYLNNLTKCHLFIDEAWRLLDSYQGTNMGLAGRELVLVTGHKDRTVNVIAQRPTSVHVTTRGNINRFYKFVKIASWPIPRFARYEFQEMSGETVDETKEPISIKTYWGSKQVFKAYNTHQFGGMKRTHELHFDAYDLTTKEKLIAIKRIIKSWFNKKPIDD